jgi:dTDP-glucose pyrophosphorylase
MTLVANTPESRDQPRSRLSVPPPRPARAVILAADKGLRPNPYSPLLSKCLFAVHDRSLLERQIAIIRDQLGIRDIVVLVGRLHGQASDALGSGERLGVALRYLEVPRVEDGPAKGLLAARDLLSEPFFLLLGDEYHHRSRHDRLLAALERAPEALFTYTPVHNPNQILANFAIELGPDDVVQTVIEKPTRILNELCGCGTLYLTPRIFELIERAEPSPRTGRVELYETAAAMCAGGRVFAVDLDDPNYVNINTLDDLRRAIFAHRSLHFADFSISVIVPTLNEAHSIAYVIRDFIDIPQVAEVLVMDNRSADGTAQIARQAGARVISRPLAGYGEAVHRGLNAAVGDILVIVEGDYSFRAADLPKLLEYLKDADLVLGTRTTRQLIAQGANMGWLTRIGNRIMAKYMEILWFWLKLRFTDLGCSYRAIWKQEWLGIEKAMHRSDLSFAMDFIIELVKARKNCIEVPVSYHPRFGGQSKHSKNLAGLVRTAFKLWKVITACWIVTVLKIVRNWCSRGR